MRRVFCLPILPIADLSRFPLQYQRGVVDFNRVFTAQSQLVTQQDQLSIARGNIASSLIAVYRALGGGWQAVENGRPPAPCRT